jgi:hypothetical protein
MKQKTLLFSAFAGILYLTLSSNDIGPAHAGNGDRTGRLGSTLTCASSNCHTGTIGTTTCTIEIRRKDWGASSAPVNGYILGKTYLVTVKGDNSSALPKYGFQLTAVNGSSTPGTFGSFPANVGAKAVGSAMLVEHTMPLSGSSGLYQTTFEWTAPTTTAGAITFWGIMNAVDGTGNENGDRTSASVSVVLADVTSVGNVTAENSINVYPNPFTTKLNIKVENAAPGTYTVNAYDIHGKKLISNEVRLTSANNEATLNTTEWSHGVYFVQIINGEVQKTMQVIK